MRLSRHGFHTLEVIVSSFIFFLMTYFLLTLLSSTQWISRKSENNLAAENLAQSEIERLRGIPFAQLSLGGSPETEIVVNDHKFKLEVTIDEVPGRKPELLKNIEVKVSWWDRNHDSDKTIVLEAYVGKIRR